MSEKSNGISSLVELNEYLRVNFLDQVIRLSSKMNDVEIAQELDLDLDTVQKLKHSICCLKNKV
jgi:hypothetical protein